MNYQAKYTGVVDSTGNVNCVGTISAALMWYLRSETGKYTGKQ
jgi:hypothetical protein